MTSNIANQTGKMLLSHPMKPFKAAADILRVLMMKRFSRSVGATCLTERDKFVNVLTKLPILIQLKRDTMLLEPRELMCYQERIIKLRSSDNP